MFCEVTWSVYVMFYFSSCAKVRIVMHEIYLCFFAFCLLLFVVVSQRQQRVCKSGVCVPSRMS